MRVLLLAPHDFYVDRGTPMDVDILVRALSAQGHTVDLVAYPGGQSRDYPGVTIHRTDAPRWLVGVPPGFSLRKVLADAWLFAKARRLLRERAYDLIHAGEEAVFFAMWFGFRTGVPYVYDMDSSIAQQMVEARPWLKPLAAFFNWCEAAAIRGSLAAAPVCEALADLARARGASHVEVLHDISNLPTPVPRGTGDLKRRLGIRGSILMYVGNLEPYQGGDLLLEAYARARGAGATSALVIAGGTEAKIVAYRRQALRLGVGDSVHLIGPWPAERLGELLAEADILVSPRTSGVNTPMKVFSYLHSGVPLLATDLRTHSQALNRDVALLAPADPQGLAEGILELERDPELRARLGRAGKRFVERNHVFAAHLNRVERLYLYVDMKLRARAAARQGPVLDLPA